VCCNKSPEECVPAVHGAAFSDWKVLGCSGVHVSFFNLFDLLVAALLGLKPVPVPVRRRNRR
jgi:hypothetical protein